jgi:hypothetical protein
LRKGEVFLDKFYSWIYFIKILILKKFKEPTLLSKKTFGMISNKPEKGVGLI